MHLMLPIKMQNWRFSAIKHLFKVNTQLNYVNFPDQCSILVMENQEHEHSAQIKCDPTNDSIGLKRHAPETAESTPAKRVRYVPKAALSIEIYL